MTGFEGRGVFRNQICKNGAR